MLKNNCILPCVENSCRILDVKYLIFNLCLIFGALTNSYSIMAQSLIDDASSVVSEQTPDGVFSETIKIISSSKRIFVLTNNNQLLGIGDFISLAKDNKLAARAMVGKTYEGMAGIKIIKIYSLTQWAQLKKDSEVQIIRGDDSQFNKKLKAEKSETVKDDQDDLNKIKSEDDLYSVKDLDDDSGISVEESKNRHIKPDNVISLGMSSLSIDDGNGGKASTSQISGSWAYQISDNIFGEFLYARAMFNDYPAEGMKSLVNTYSGRIKYNFKGPLFTYILPYVGFMSQSVSSPDAGKGVAGGSATPAGMAKERELVNKLNKSGAIFGITIMRRLVPGWFLKADLGTDVLNLGVGIEF
jgi:hypothetical protein